jgi:hypothetical protein
MLSSLKIYNRIENEWKNTNEIQQLNYLKFNELNNIDPNINKILNYYDPNYSNLTNTENNCSISRENIYDGIYITINNFKYLIGDFDNIQIYKNKWIKTEIYESWAYMDYLASYKIIRSYHSKNSVNINSISIELPFDLPENIIFRIGRNDPKDNTIYLENNLFCRYRISDHESYRNYYERFFRII